MKSILVIKPSSLGDVVHTLPAVRRLKRQWPESHITWIVNPEWSPLLEGNPDIDEIIVFPRGEFRGIGGKLKAVSWFFRLRRLQPDLVLDFQGLLRSALMARCSRGKRLLGLSDAREGATHFYHDVVDVRDISHAIDRYLALAAHAGVEDKAEVGFPLPAGSRPNEFSTKADPFILLHPFSRGEGKSMTTDAVATFCKTVAPFPVVIVGRSHSTLSEAPNVTNLLNRTSLTELIWLIRQARFTISVDSGPMHIAAAITSNLLSVHSWSNPALVGPYQPDAWVWKNGQITTAAEARQHTGAKEAGTMPDQQQTTTLAQWIKARWEA